jgi:sugar lactone lactonase YvrE
VETLKSELLTDDVTYGEGPRWHDGRLWFTDGMVDLVKTVDEAGHVEVVLQTNHPSGLGWLPDGTLVLCTLQSPHVMRVDDGEVSLVHDFGDYGWSTNDMVVSPEGRIYTDVYEMGDAQTIIGRIGLIAPDGDVRIVAEGLSTPNGLAITPDGGTLICADSFGSAIYAFTITDDGSLADRRVFADLGERRPDGICLDEEGAIWVGLYDANEFVRILDGGEITHRVECPGAWAVATALGGEDRRTLFLIINDTDYEGMANNRSDGRIETVRVDVPGAGWP